MKKAFTLIELLIVVAIIGILSTIVIVNVGGAKQKSNYAKAVADMEAISKAARAYEASNNGLPVDIGPGVTFTEPEARDLIPVWPAAPCSGWSYDWDTSWPGPGVSVVSLRNSSVNIVNHFCVAGTATQCSTATGTVSILDVASKSQTCN